MGWDDNGLADRAPRAELLRRALRSAPRRTTRTSCRRRSRGKDAIPISRPNFLELCAQLVAQDEQAFEELWRAARSVGRLDAHLHDDRARRRAARASARSCATSRAARRTRPTRRRCGTSTIRTAVAQAELEDREMAGAYHALRVPPRRRRGRRADRHDAARAARRVRRGRRASRRRALPAAVRHRGRHAAVRRAGSRRRAPSRRSREGHRHRDDLHVRRHHRRRRGGASCSSRRAPIIGVDGRIKRRAARRSRRRRRRRVRARSRART